MATKYLDSNGLAYFWEKIKAKISSMISDEAGKMIPYGFCSTEAKTVAKTVTVSPSITELTTGLTIAVRFQYANTATNPTLNVNSLGAKSIYRYGSTVAGASAATSWNAQAVVTLTYNGSAWMLNDFNNTTYSALSATDMETGTATTARLITAQRLKQAVEYHAPVTSVNGQTGDVTVSGGSGTSTPTADTLAEFDSTAHMHSTDMTATEVSDFVDGLDVHGGIETEVIQLTASSFNHVSSVPTATLYKKGNVGVLYMNVYNTSANLAVGSDASFSISGLPTMIFAAFKGVGYSGSTALVFSVSASTVSMRVIGSAWVANYNCAVSIPLIFE